MESKPCLLEYEHKLKINVTEFYKKWKRKVIVVWLKFSCDFNKLVEILLQSHYMTILLIRMALFFTRK